MTEMSSHFLNLLSYRGDEITELLSVELLLDALLEHRNCLLGEMCFFYFI